MNFVKFIANHIGILVLFLIVPLTVNNPSFISNKHSGNYSVQDSVKSIIVSKDILVKNYFQYLDSVVNIFNNKEELNLTEHLLVRYNPWIIDTLAQTDYYKMKAKDSFVYNQKELIVLRKGSKIFIPDSLAISNLLTIFEHTSIDINIPEFKLRVMQDSIEILQFPVRVGRNEKKYLKMGDRITDLKTKLGVGKIINHVKNPDYYNPANGRRYYFTRRDDEKVTKLPQVPFLETEINGIRNGQLIHPTTNPETLKKAYSNGCIGTGEGDAWVLYYYAPINTKVVIRYNLKSIDNKGDTLFFKNIYGYNSIMKE